MKKDLLALPRTKHIAAIADLHVGSEAGLTTQPTNRMQRQMLKTYKETIDAFKPVDVLIVNGDVVDGLDKKANGVSTSIHNRDLQDKIGADLIEMWGVKNIILVRGTTYHVADDTDHEQIIAEILRSRGFNVTYRRKANILINNWFRLQVRHKINTTSVLASRGTAVSNARITGFLNKALAKKPPNDLSIYAHAHYFIAVEDVFGASIILPAWQGLGSAFGDLECDGHVDLGAVRLTVQRTREEGWSWQKRLYLAQRRQSSIVL